MEVNGEVAPNPHLRTADVRTLKIKSLPFGYSPLKRKDTSAVASYLDSVVSPHCKMVKTFTNLLPPRKADYLSQAGRGTLDNRADMWGIVGESLELLCVAKRRKDQEALILQRTISSLQQELERVKQELTVANQKCDG